MKFKVKGTFAEAVVFARTVDQTALSQIKELCSQSFVSGSRIRIMPDVHAGAGCTIGTTMTITDKIVPNLVGVDIGCGMEVSKLGACSVNYPQLDAFIKRNIPSGMNVRKEDHEFTGRLNLDQLACRKYTDLGRAKKSIGTLGGGNHFIEIDYDDEGSLYLVVHSGSRHVGNQTASYYQKEAIKQCQGKEIPNSLCYAKGYLFDDYINDMKIIQNFAFVNRKAITSDIIAFLGVKPVETFTTIHNYIDTESMILRKGAVSAKNEEIFLIPLNMRDGSLICKGKGKSEWNFSAPHGAGRLMSRKQAKAKLDLAEYKSSMENIYTSSVDSRTLDEAPMAYKDKNEIIEAIEETADIVKTIRPLYNFKAPE